MARPSLALCMIVRDEVHNLPKLFKSIEGCADEVHITDTGSVDGTQAWLVENGEKIAGCPVYLHHFEWINDFAAARNYSFSHAKTDYLFWLDGDDVLHNREGFIQWRDHAMQFADGWYANYHYAVDTDMKPLISFVRERVVKNNGNFKWQYFVHEGLVPQKPDMRMSLVPTWSVKHLRSEEDFNKDRSRNVKMLEDKKDTLCARLLFYYGKELHDNGKPEEALKVLLDAAVRPDLEAHDRILALQYACYASTQLAERMKPEYQAEKYMLCDKLAKQGLELAPTRAEFYCVIADSYIKRNKLLEALPYLQAAEGCVRADQLNVNAADPIFYFKDCYDVHPKMQRAKIYYHLGRLDQAEDIIQELVKRKVKDAPQMLEEITKARNFMKVDDSERVKNDDIVFTCPPNAAYPFDEVIYQTKPLGGSETAMVQMATRLKKLTGKRVIVFNDREGDLYGPSGVEWKSIKTVPEYFAKNLPAAHIAWRHNIRVTQAPTYLWGHDLVTYGVDQAQNFDKMLCLSNFHKNYTQAMQGVPKDKIVLTRNGIDPDKFKFERPKKNPNKLVFMSSPDRGLDNAMKVVDILRETHPDVELHIYYGFDNMYKYGQAKQADMLQAMIAERPWVKAHGFTEQNKMYREVADAVIWMHPCNFIETFCITALEMLALGIYPITRRLGALQDTLAEAHTRGDAVLFDNETFGYDDLKKYACAASNVLSAKSWEKIKFDIDKHSWQSVAEEWVKILNLS